MTVKRSPKKIAVFRTDRIGEVLLATVAIEILKKNFPEAQVVFFTSEYSRDLLQHRYDVDAVISLNPFRKAGTVFQAVCLAKELRAHQCDMSIVLNPHRVPHLACFLAGIRDRIGYDRKWSFFLTQRVADHHHLAQCHEVEYTRRLFRDIGMDPEGAQPRLYVSDEARRRVRDALVQEGVDPKQVFVVVHPCTSNPLKAWRFTKYVSLLKHFARIFCQVVVIGEQKDHPMIVDMITQSGSPAFNAAGRFTLGELAALLQMSRLFVGNDSGPMHMAAVLGVPVVAIFSKKAEGSNPVRWGPVGEGHTIFYELCGAMPLRCDDCNGHFIAEDDVSAERVFKMCETYL